MKRDRARNLWAQGGERREGERTCSPVGNWKNSIGRVSAGFSLLSIRKAQQSRGDWIFWKSPQILDSLCVCGVCVVAVDQVVRVLYSPIGAIAQILGPIPLVLLHISVAVLEITSGRNKVRRKQSLMAHSLLCVTFKPVAWCWNVTEMHCPPSPLSLLSFSCCNNTSVHSDNYWVSAQYVLCVDNFLLLWIPVYRRTFHMPFLTPYLICYLTCDIIIVNLSSNCGRKRLQWFWRQREDLKRWHHKNIALVC